MGPFVCRPSHSDGRLSPPSSRTKQETSKTLSKGLSLPFLLVQTSAILQVSIFVQKTSNPSFELIIHNLQRLKDLLKHTNALALQNLHDRLNNVHSVRRLDSGLVEHTIKDEL